MFPPRSHHSSSTQRTNALPKQRIVKPFASRFSPSSSPLSSKAPSTGKGKTRVWQRFETPASRRADIQRKKRRQHVLVGIASLSICIGALFHWATPLQNQVTWLSTYIMGNGASNANLAAATTAAESWQHSPFHLNHTVRVGIQAGHWRAANHPPELSKLRTSTGASAFGIDEVDVNLAVAEQIKAQLESYGILVDILPATVPPNYQADLFLSLHADGVEGAPYRRGYKSSYAFSADGAARNASDPILKRHIDRSYLSATHLPHDASNVQANMSDYFAFNRRYAHSLHPNTPGLVVEMGYLTNRYDNTFLRDTKRPAAAISDGILGYLREQGRIPSVENNLLASQ